MPIQHGPRLTDDAGLCHVQAGSRLPAVGKGRYVANGIVFFFVLFQAGSKVALIVLNAKKHDLTQRPWQLLLGYPCQTAVGIRRDFQFVKEQETAAVAVL